MTNGMIVRSAENDLAKYIAARSRISMSGWRMASLILASGDRTVAGPFLGWVPFLSVKLLHQLSPPPFDGFQANREFPGFGVEVGQLLLELLLVQVVLPALFSDERFDFVPQQPIPGIAVHVAFTELQLARSDRCDDLLLRQAQLLPSRLVAQSGPFS